MENDLEKVLLMNSLFDIYGELLSDKQKQIFYDYYQDNLSLSEIAENLNISRNAVFDTLKTVENYLLDYENKLAILKKIHDYQETLKSLHEEKHLDDYAYSKLKEN